MTTPNSARRPTLRQLPLPLVDARPQAESARDRLLRVLSGSDLLRLASELPSSGFSDRACREATDRAKAVDHRLQATDG
jgi:hypothetical protein